MDSLPGDSAEKERLKAILATLSGELPAKEASEQLGVSESRFHELRQAALKGMLSGLAPRPPGRPPKERESPDVQALQERVAWLEEELEISRLRTEIAMWKPSLLRDPAPPPEKRGSSSKGKGRRRRKRDGRGGT